MNAHRIDILHITYSNAVAVAVSDHFIFNFFPTADIAFNKDLTDTAQSQTIAGNIMQLLCIMGNTAAAAAQCISWSDNNRITVLLCKIKTSLKCCADFTGCTWLADLLHCLFECQTVFGFFDGL